MECLVKKFYHTDFAELSETKRFQYSKALIEQLIQDISMADFVESEYDLMLESSGNGWVKTNCLMPNHSDSSPSFGINTEKNYYNCFGCGSTGNIIKLVQNAEGLNFVEAIQRLCQYSGIETDTSDLEIKQVLRELNSTINEFLNRKAVTDLPGGMSETRYLFSIAKRLKTFEQNRNYNPKDTRWVEKIYCKIDDYMLEGNHSKLNDLWKNLGIKIKERLKND